MKPRELFPTDYADARRRFLSAAENLKAWTQSFPIAARGPEGEPLSIDIAYLGPGAPKRLLIVSSGTHGVEGYAGTAIQLAFLKQYRGSQGSGKKAGVLLIHAVNPFGYAHGRRTNEHNVDLNRNALEQFPGPRNAVYARLDPWLNPASPPRRDLFLARGLWHLLRRGPAAVKQAIAGGQYEFPKGIFYGGASPAESLKRLTDILHDAPLQSAERVLHVDLHTGLGNRGDYKVLVDFDESSSEFARMREWFGKDFVQGNRPKRSIAYRVSGGLDGLLRRAYPSAQVYPAVLEFGTYPLTRMIAVLREENRAHFHAAGRPRLQRRAKARLLETFFPADARWRAQIVKQGLRVLGQAQRALGERA